MGIKAQCNLQTTGTYISHTLFSTFAADNNAGSFTSSPLHCHNDYCHPSVPNVWSFMKKQLMCFSPHKYSAQHSDYLLFTVTVLWLIWLGALPNYIICMRSASLLIVSRRLFLIAPTISTNHMITFSSDTADMSSSTYTSHTLSHNSKHNTVSCGKCEGTVANHSLPTNTREL